ncbi:MAG TPA: hypothetical protein VGK41_04870 [Solirubrobacterales bacterium]
MSDSIAGVVTAYREGFHAMATDLFALEETVNVVYTAAGMQYADDLVVVEGVDWREDIATMGNRGRELTLELTLITSSFRAGGPEADNEAFAAAATLLNRLAEKVRRNDPDGDTTLGDTVRHCFLTSAKSRTVAAKSAAGIGRLWEFESTFTAQARVRG